MVALTPTCDPGFIERFAGEVIGWELQLVDDATGDVEQLPGRTIVATIYQNSTEIETGAGVVTAGPDSHAAGEFAGTVSAALLGRAALHLQISELVENGRRVHVDLPLRIKRSPGTLTTPAEPGDAGAGGGRFVVRLGPDGPRLVVTQLGARGLSAAEQLARTIDPDTDAPYIAEDTVPAMADWLRSISVGSTDDAAAYAHTWGDYAHAQGDYAKAQGDANGPPFTVTGDGTDQTLALLAAFDGLVPPHFRPGDTFHVESTLVPAGQLAFFPLGARVYWNCTAPIRIIRHWDGSSDARIVETLGKPMWLIRDWYRSSLGGVTVSHDPPLQVDADITGFTFDNGGAKTGIIFRLREGETLGFVSADKIVSRVPSKKGEKDGPWTYFRQRLQDGSKASLPGPITDLGGGLYKITPQLVNFDLEDVKGLYPLCLRSSLNVFGPEQQVLVAGVGGLMKNGASIINGRVCKVALGQQSGADDDGDTDNEPGNKDLRFYYADNGEPVDGRDATDYVPNTGTITGIPVPTYFDVGEGIRIVCRKRASNSVVINRTVETSLTKWTLYGSPALAVAGNLNTDLTVRGWLIDKPGAGGFLLNNTRGRIVADDMLFVEMGDCSFATRATDWTPSVVDWDVDEGTIDVEGWATGDFKERLPARPEPRYRVGFLHDGELIDDLTVLSVTDSQAKFTTPLPLGYDPATWTLMPYDYVCDVDTPYLTILGSSSSGVAIQSSNWTFGTLYGAKIRTGFVRCANPGTGQPGSTGFLDGFTGDAIIARECGSKEPRTRDTVLTLRRTTNTGDVATAPQNRRASFLKLFDVDGTDYGSIGAHDTSIVIDVLKLRDTCRVTPADDAAPAARFDLAPTNGGKITVLHSVDKLPTYDTSDAMTGVVTIVHAL